MVMKAHKKIKSGMWLIVETVLVFVLGWFLADPEIMKLYRSMFIPMGWDYENVVVVPVDVLPDYDPDYRPEAMERERMTEDFRRIGEVISSVGGVKYAAPCRPYFPGIDNHMYGRVFRDSTHFMECSMLYRVTGSDFMEVFGYEWVLPDSSPFLTEDAVGRVVVSEDLAEFLFPGENPIGKSFESTESGTNVVVGVIPRQKLREITGVPTPVLIANIAAVNYDELSNGGAYWVVRVADGTDLDSFIPELNRVLPGALVAGLIRQSQGNCGLPLGEQAAGQHGCLPPQCRADISRPQSRARSLLVLAAELAEESGRIRCPSGDGRHSGEAAAQRSGPGL